MRKRIVSVLLITAMVIAFPLSIKSVKAASIYPSITFVGLDRSPILEGTKQTFYITSKDGDMVQYRIWIRYPGTNTWEDITKGYTSAVKANEVYKVTPDKVLQEGEFFGSIWVKRAGQKGSQSNSNGDFDSYYTFTFPVVKNDGKNLNIEGNLKTYKEVYNFGEAVNVNGIENISGLSGNFKYKLHAYDITRNRWINDIDGYSDTLTWTPVNGGKYMLDVWVIDTNNLNTNVKYNGFKLKPIEVKEPTDEEFFKQPNIEKKCSIGETFDVKNGKIYFKGSSYNNYLPDEKLNPNINKQVYELTKALIDDEKYSYVIAYRGGGNEYSAADVKLCPNKKYQAGIFTFAFSEYQKTDYNSQIALTVDGLSDNSDKYRPCKDIYDPYYMNQLKTGLIALFGEVNGTEIYNYVFSNCIRIAEKPLPIADEIETKQFGNIEVTFTNHSRICSYYFNIK